MQTVTSKDGTTIAYDSYGRGPAVILVAGALSQRSYKKFPELAGLLQDRFTIVNYDRRGRGDSGDTLPYALEREIEDIEALIEAAGGSASLWGWSSGAALALRAAGAGIGVEKVMAYEPPFMVEPGKRPTPDYGERLQELVAADRRSDAVKHFMRNAVGVPAPIVKIMPLLPMWDGLEAVAHTLPYDLAAMGDGMSGKPLRAEDWAGVTAPTLVVYGSKSPANLQAGSKAIAEALPNAELRELQGQSHNVSMKKLAPVVTEYFARTKNPAATAGPRTHSGHPAPPRPGVA